ncbi:MAG: redoxin domain-containing protein [Opitutae bacterium]
MKKLLLILSCFTAIVAFASPEIGKNTSDFTGKTIDGKTVKLSDFKGKIVVLEWYNPTCPFVKKFYSVGKMQDYQAEVTEAGHIWITINTGGKIPDLKSAVTADKNKATVVIDDADGAIAKLFDAKTTPHCFVINREGVLVYKGAIDNISSAKSSDIDKATNYVLAAVAATHDNKKIEVNSTKSYGCGVKY